MKQNASPFKKFLHPAIKHVTVKQKRKKGEKTVKEEKRDIYTLT